MEEPGHIGRIICGYVASYMASNLSTSVYRATMDAICAADAVIAGSFVLHCIEMLAHPRGTLIRPSMVGRIVAWKPHDIDVFVSRENFSLLSDKLPAPLVESQRTVVNVINRVDSDDDGGDDVDTAAYSRIDTVYNMETGWLPLNIIVVESDPKCYIDTFDFDILRIFVSMSSSVAQAVPTEDLSTLVSRIRDRHAHLDETGLVNTSPMRMNKYTGRGYAISKE